MFSKLKNKLNKLKKIKLFLSLSLLFLMTPSFAFAGAGGIVGFFSNVVFAGFSMILYVIFKFIGSIFWLAMKLLNLVISGSLFNAVFFSEGGRYAINQGWMVVRDFFNLFFILILIFIAISIILNIEKYNDKKLIFKVVIAAILINFSKAITLVVIDVSQLAMNFFANALTVSGQSFVSIFSYQMGLGSIFSFKFGEAASFFVALLFATIFMFIITGMIMMITIAMLVRLVAFWVLIIISPAAMFGMALPGSALGKMTDKWSTKLISWAFFGPIMMFFLWIALVVVAATTAATKSTLSLTSFAGQGWDPNTISLMRDILQMSVSYIAAIYLLYYGYDLSQEISDGAAKSVLGWGKKNINKWGKTSLRAGGLAGLGLTTFGAYAAKDGISAMGHKLSGGRIGSLNNPLKRSEAGLIVPARMEGKLLGVRNKALANEKYQPITNAFTEEGRKRNKEIIKGHSSEKAAEKIERDKINEKAKEYKDGKMHDNKLSAVLKDVNATNTEKVAALTLLAENGKIKEGDDYNLAEELVDGLGEGSTKENIMKNLEKKNLLGRFRSGKTDEDKNEAKKEVKKEIDKMNSLEEILKLNKDLLKESEVMSHVKTLYGKDQITNLYRQGKLSGGAISALRTDTSIGSAGREIGDSINKKSIEELFETGDIGKVKQELNKMKSLKEMLGVKKEILQESQVIDHILTQYKPAQITDLFNRGELSPDAIEAIKDYQGRA